MLTQEQETWLAAFADKQIVVENRDKAIATQASIVATTTNARETFVATKQAELKQAITDYDASH